MAATFLRLGIYRLSPSTAQRVRQFGGTGPRKPLGEQIYSWSTKEDIYTSIAETGERDKIREQILSFNDGESDTELSMERLCSLTEELEKISQKETWAPAKFIHPQGEFGGDTRSSPTLAFAHHLRWVCETFMDTPNLMVIFE